METQEVRNRKALLKIHLTKPKYRDPQMRIEFQRLLLVTFPIFRIIRDHQPPELDCLAQISNHLDQRDFDQKVTILHQGDKSNDECYLIITGQADVFINERLRTTIQPTELFGELALLADGNRTATVRATHPTNCFMIPGEAFR